MKSELEKAGRRRLL